MAQDIPASVGWLTVTAEGISSFADSDDAGNAPDARPMIGAIDFTNGLAGPIVAIAETPSKFISMASIKCEFDGDGILRPPSDGVAPPIDPAGNLYIVAPDQPSSLSRTNWEWTATFKPYTGQTWKQFTVTFGGAPNDVINLADTYATQNA